MNANFFDLSKRKRRDILFGLLLGAPAEGIISNKEINAVNRLITPMQGKNAPAEKKCKHPETKKVTAGEKKPAKKNLRRINI